MNFLYPDFLFALLAVVIPVIIHLFNFRKYKKVYFSNVAFLKEVEEQRSSREKLKNLLILLSRILAITFLVLAFSRPFLSSVAQADYAKPNIVSIYIDNSYSMDAVNKEGSLLEEAKRRAREIVKTYRLNDRFQLLTNDFEGKHQRLLNADEFLQALEEVKVSSASRNLQQVVNRQQGVFVGSTNRFAYVISDFQEGFVGNEPVQKDNETQISLVKLHAANLPNLSVDSVWFLSPVHQPNIPEKMVVRIKNYGNKEANNVPLTLTINARQKAARSVSVAASSTLTDTISYSGLTSGWQKAVLSIKDYPLTFDDQLNFSFQVSPHQQILSINGPRKNRYIHTLFAIDPYFKLTEFNEDNINYAAFGNYSMLIANELTNLSTGLAQELKNYINNGGSVAIFPHTKSDINAFSAFLTSIGLSAAVELIEEPTKVSHIELKHPLFRDVFETLPKNMDMPQVNRYFTYAQNSRFNKEDILRLPAGRLYFSRYKIGKGQVYLAASGLDEGDGNLAKHPLFVPLMYRAAFESMPSQPLFYVVAQDNAITLPPVKLGPNQSLMVEGNGAEIIPQASWQNGKTLLYMADQVRTPGFYEVKKGDSVLAVVAFNENRAESNVNYSSKSDLEKSFGPQKINLVDTSTENISSAVAIKNNGTELWKLCLILTLVFIAVEILLIRFFNTITNIRINEPHS